MICFEPRDSGINSMLGQMMWFRRFCECHGIAHDFAVDLDRSPRNIVTQSVHDLLLGPQPRLNLRLDFDETLGLNAFVWAVRSGSFSPKGKRIRVLAGVPRDPSEPGLWLSHAFQLHCLDSGFLSDRYPYWAADLSDLCSAGELARSGVVSAPGPVPERLFVHMRLGD